MWLAFCFVSLSWPAVESGAAQGRILEVDQRGGKTYTTLAAAMAQARAGDTVRLAAGSGPYHETVVFRQSGEPGKPIVFDGNGETVTGCDPLDPAGWTQVRPGLYKSDKLLGELQESDDAAKLQRMYLLFDGSMQRMGRTSKGSKTPFPKAEDLKPGQWTFDADSKTFFVCVAGSLADARIEAPYRRNGVAMYGRKGHALEHLVVRNVLCTHVLNDGFNLHGTCKDILFENIAAYENGDDGYSAHDDCESTVNGYWASRNSTGVGNAYHSMTRLNNIHLEGNFGCEFMTGHAALHEVHDAVIRASAGAMPLMVINPQGARTVWDHVLLTGSRHFTLQMPAGCVLEARQVTFVGQNWSIAGEVRINDSVISAHSLECKTDGAWRGDNNVYSIARITIADQRLSPQEFLTRQQAAQQDLHSHCKTLGAEELSKLQEAAVPLPPITKSLPK